MWTPKRIIMLSGCFMAIFVAYLSYACTALGRMDGLPPLPEAYWPNTPPEVNLHVPMRNGPLHYHESKRLVWTEDNVRIEDHKSKPKPHKISGKGMTMVLSTEPVHDPKHPGRKPVSENITGVKSILLHSSVVM